MLRFSDGMEIDTSGKLRILRKRDGLYVVGKGLCIPVDSVEEAEDVIRDFEPDLQKGE